MRVVDNIRQGVSVSLSSLIKRDLASRHCQDFSGVRALPEDRRHGVIGGVRIASVPYVPDRDALGCGVES